MNDLTFDEEDLEVPVYVKGVKHVRSITDNLVSIDLANLGIEKLIVTHDAYLTLERFNLSFSITPAAPYVSLFAFEREENTTEGNGTLVLMNSFLSGPCSDFVPQSFIFEFDGDGNLVTGFLKGLLDLIKQKDFPESIVPDVFMPTLGKGGMLGMVNASIRCFGEDI
eukprot:CAMPEP_0198201004 /NCGR_PEP_ID=MMETSP1445-20131203/3849_1 /TAXON_ID=36898 /ORGANISM="Pyramimonas sp., Strain CCMP2087" /LENGTH=166 /DNA_ID=CAMNT_0043871179 /DNA_START=362 /DNA_END=859 /DNA_ORIENTATION=-